MVVKKSMITSIEKILVPVVCTRPNNSRASMGKDCKKQFLQGFQTEEGKIVATK